ncbi:10309_t:CDS:2, partial [Racocetra persica]
EYEEKIRVIKEELQRDLDNQKQEYEEKMKALEASNLETDVLRAEKKQMEEKLKMVQEEMARVLESQAYPQKMKRLSDASQYTYSPDSPPYTEEQLRLIRMALTKWRRQRFVQMAEVILSNAVILKEANVISKELGKKILYQFTIIEDEPYTNPVSSWESTSALNQYNNNEDSSLHLSKKPCIGVKVIDTKNDVIYIWSLDKLKSRLQKMRNLYNFIDRPQYSKHFNWEDPFYENPSPQYTFIGSCAVGLTCLLLKKEFECDAPIICRYSGDLAGYCRIRIKFLTEFEESSSKDTPTTDDKQKEISQKLLVNKLVVFEVNIIELCGISESRYDQVHVQYKLSSFGNVAPLSPGEHLYCTERANDFGNSKITYNYKQNLTMAVSPAMMEVLTNGVLTFEVFGRAKRIVLEEIELWDNEKECPSYRRNNGNVPESSVPRERRSEEELVAEEKHDVVAWVQVCELASTGEYVPVQVLSQNSLDPGAFFLRQGLQRRIVLTLTHNSGRQFPWTKVSKMEIGRVRLLDGKGRLSESPVQNDIQMNLLPTQTVQFNRDGTSVVVVQASWDSTLHDSIFLNRTTHSSSRVLLGLTWYVEAEKCVEPITFSMDIAVQVQGREARPPSKLIQLLNQSKVLWKSSGLFSVTLKPPMTRKISELWRLNTANKYVRGEELLIEWKPRGVSLVKDYKKISELIRRREAVDCMKQVIALKGTKEYEQLKSPEDLRKYVLTLWTKKWGTTKEIVINQEPPLSGLYQDIELSRGKKPTKLVAQVRMVAKTDTITKKGYLFTPEDANDDHWVKRWYVLRRPYLFIYESPKETEEQGVINLASVRVDYKRDLEDMLQRQHVFAIDNRNIIRISDNSDNNITISLTFLPPFELVQPT